MSFARLGRLTILLFSLNLAQPSAALAQTTTPAPLPAAAQEAINKGIIAAKVPDYLLAIRYFEEARKLAPQAPVIFLDMGLAESRIPGRELRAIAWFGAYLAAYPDAPNAAAVKEQIAVLDVTNRSSVSRLIRTAQEAAARSAGMPQASGLYKATEYWLEFGDIAGAQEATDLIRLPSIKSAALVLIARKKFRAGDAAGAKNALSAAIRSANDIGAEPAYGIQSSQTRKMILLEYIAKEQASEGDSSGAHKTADLIEEITHKGRAQRGIAESQIESGAYADAQETLAMALKTTEIMPPEYRARALDLIAKLRTVASDALNRGPERRPASRAQPSSRTAAASSDWLRMLDDDNASNDCPLNTMPFLNIGEFMKSLPPAQSSQDPFAALHMTIERVAKAREVVVLMLKQASR